MLPTHIAKNDRLRLPAPSGQPDARPRACPARTFAARHLALFLIILGAWLGAPQSSASAATYGQEVLAAVLLAEARGEGEVGMRAVAEVVRCRADALGVSMLSVLKPGAFSSLNGTTRDELLRRFHRHPLFPLALQIARQAYNEPESLGNLTRGANHFTHKREKPYWSAGHQPVVVIGNHAFYLLPITPG